MFLFTAKRGAHWAAGPWRNEQHVCAPHIAPGGGEEGRLDTASEQQEGRRGLISHSQGRRTRRCCNLSSRSPQLRPTTCSIQHCRIARGPGRGSRPARRRTRTTARGRRYNLAQCWAQEWNAGVAGPHCPPGSAPAPAPTRPGRRPQARACARLCEPAPCPQACGRESAPPYRQAGRARLPPVPAAPCPPFAHCRPAVAGPHSQRLWTQASDFGCTQPCARSEIHFFHTKFPDSLNSTVG